MEPSLTWVPSSYSKENLQTRFRSVTMSLSVSDNCFMRCTSVSSTFRFSQDKVFCNCKLLSLGLLQLFSCKNAISSKYLHFGKEDAAPPDLVILECLSRHFFRLSLRFFRCFCKDSTIIKNNNCFTRGFGCFYIFLVSLFVLIKIWFRRIVLLKSFIKFFLEHT